MKQELITCSLSCLYTSKRYLMIDCAEFLSANLHTCGSVYNGIGPKKSIRAGDHFAFNEMGKVS